MAEVERIWRVRTETRAIELRLFVDNSGEQLVVLEQAVSADGDGGVLDIPLARAVAQAMLEACEVAQALGE